MHVAWATQQMIREAAREAPIIQLQVPWGSMAVVVVVAYAVTLLTTWLPAAQAARLPPAEALRYE